MSLIINISFILLFIFSIPVNCQDSNNGLEWASSNYYEGCRSLMNALHQEWLKTDGELTFNIGRKLFWALLLDPNAFYVEFSYDTINYERFAQDLNKLVFWNPNDTTISHLKRLRLIAIDRLTEQTYSIDSNYIGLHEEMIEIIKQIKPTFID